LPAQFLKDFDSSCFPDEQEKEELMAALATVALASLMKSLFFMWFVLLNIGSKGLIVAFAPVVCRDESGASSWEEQAN
jgi:hypothetical protein